MSPVLAQSLQRLPLNGSTGSLRQVWKTRLFLTALPCPWTRVSSVACPSRHEYQGL
jgi:hypothetical protein